MRFVLAMVAFALAAALTAAGIAQRTIFLPDDQVADQTSISSQTNFIVIPNDVLHMHTGKQTLLLDGSDDPFVAYGRTSDITAWLGEDAYAEVTVGDDSALTITQHKAAESSDDGPSQENPDDTKKTDHDSADHADASDENDKSDVDDKSDDDDKSAKKDDSTTSDDAAKEDDDETVPSPVGSDLWLEEYSGDAARITKTDVPDDISILVASADGSSAPTSVRLVWPMSNATPWAGPLLVGGAVLFIVGFLLYLSALRGMRRSRGPRRGGGGPKMPRLPKSRSYQPTGRLQSSRRRGITRFVALIVPLAVGGGVLSGCSADYWPDLTPDSPEASPAPAAPSDEPDDEEERHPAVTASQLHSILSSVAEVAAQADKDRDDSAAAARFTGDALTFREALYTMKAKGDDAPLAIPDDFDVTLALPQATRSWPRSVLAVVQQGNDETTTGPTPATDDADDEKVDDEAETPPVVLFLTQKSPRDNYLVSYAMPLLPDPNVPSLPSATDGGTLVPPDSKFLRIAPDELGAAYADVLLKGDKSEWADLFATEGDSLRKDVGATAKKKDKDDLPDTAELSYSNDVGSGAPLSMATNDSGAIVATDFVEVSTIKPVEDSALVYNSDRGKALSGIESSSTGLRSTHSYQVLFYVPPENSDDKITILGYTRVLTDSEEIE